MTANAKSSRFVFSIVGAVAVLLLPAADVLADCVRDSRGEVYCGAGRCNFDRNGVVWCSRSYDGGADIKRHGSVRQGTMHQRHPRPDFLLVGGGRGRAQG